MSAALTGALGGAGSGAAIGTGIAPGIGTAIGAGIGGLVGLFSGSQADSAAQASQQMAQAQFDQARQWRNDAMGFSQASPSELAALSKQTQLATQATDFAQKQVALSQDIIKSSMSNTTLAQTQQRDILNGKIPSYLSPLQKQLAIQQQQEQNRIGAAMGRGAATSSAGIAAASQFGQDSAMTLMGAQQNALGVLGNMGAANAQIGLGYYGAQNNVMQNAFGLDANLLQSQATGYGNIQGRMTNASLGANINSFAGAGSVGQLYSGQYGAAMGNQLAGIGASTGMNLAFSPYSPLNKQTPSGPTNPGMSTDQYGTYTQSQRVNSDSFSLPAMNSGYGAPRTYSLGVGGK